MGLRQRCLLVTSNVLNTLTRRWYVSGLINTTDEEVTAWQKVVNYHRTVLVLKWQLSTLEVKRLKARADDALGEGMTANAEPKSKKNGWKRARPRIPNTKSKGNGEALDQPHRPGISIKHRALQVHGKRSSQPSHTTDTQACGTTKPSTKSVWKDFEMKLSGSSTRVA